MKVNPASRIFLLLGSHEENTDTIILALADPVANRVCLVSFPRDLYWKGLKLNGYYRRYSPAQFLREFSEITGLEVDRYMAIDMFAFIDAVNALGGISVTLDAPLVDPTYRTFDNGVWSTLYYRKGTHSLNGVQALRIARSRATTMDFGRARRQHLIIDAISRRLKEVAAREPLRLYPLIKTLFKYVDTNFSPYELADLAIRFRNAEFDSGHMVDSDNVLFSTYSNVYFLPEGADPNQPGFDLGQWILLPKDNNWNAIKWYIGGVLADELE